METTFIDAQQMHRNNPRTFAVPSDKELDGIKVGDYVKVAVEGERFWVLVEGILNDTYTGKVWNDMVLTKEHGLRFKDKVTFERRHIYSILTT